MNSPLRYPGGKTRAITGNIYEVECLKYLTELGFDCERFGGSSRNSDIIVHTKDGDVKIECKNTLKGTDFREWKLDLIDGHYVCSNTLINNYVPQDLFGGNELPKNISSKEWNRTKLPTFKDVIIRVNPQFALSNICDIDYVFVNGVGNYAASDNDPLNLNLETFPYTFKLRFYVKNHSSSNAVKCSLSAVATLKVE